MSNHITLRQPPSFCLKMFPSMHKAHQLSLQWLILISEYWATLWENLLFVYAHIKAQISSWSDQRLCFRYVNSTIPLLPKSEISSLKLPSVYSLVCVGPCRNPKRKNFSWRDNILSQQQISHHWHSFSMIASVSHVMRKPVLRGFRPGLTQSRLYNRRRWLEAWIFGFRNYLCSEDKGTDQLRGYHAADLRISFCIS